MTKLLGPREVEDVLAPMMIRLSNGLAGVMKWMPNGQLSLPRFSGDFDVSGETGEAQIGPGDGFCHVCIGDGVESVDGDDTDLAGAEDL